LFLSLLDGFDRVRADRWDAANEAACFFDRERHSVHVACVATYSCDELLFVISTGLVPAFTPKRLFHDLLRRA
jgi:hypothetical protein